MKRDISDLLNDYRLEEDMDIVNETPLSPSRIKELTMRMIENHNTTQKETGRKLRFPVRILAVAAVVAVLAGSAFAAERLLGAGSLLEALFAPEDSALSQGQMEVLDQLGKVFDGEDGTAPAAVTDNGATITPLAAIADENVYYLRLRVEAPEGVILPDLDEDVDGYYQLYGDGVDGARLSLDFSAYEVGGWSMGLTPLPDSDPTDNVKEFMLLIQASEVKFNDGTSKVLTLGGLSIQSPDKVYTTLFGGEFTFEIGLNYESKVVSVDCGGATWYNEVYGFTNILDELEVSPLSMTYSFRSNLQRNDWVIPGVGEIRIVLKDGTVFYPEHEIVYRDGALTAHPKFDPSDVKDDYVYSKSDYIAFEKPLDLSQVDHIQYGETIIPFPGA